MKYTYLLEYFYTDKPEDVYSTLWSDDANLKDSFDVTSKHTFSVYTTLVESRLGFFLTHFPYSERNISDLYFRNSEWKIHVRVLSRYNNTFDKNEPYASNEFRAYLQFLSNAIHQIENEQLTDDMVDDISVHLNRYSSAVLLNHIYVKALLPFEQNIDKARSLFIIAQTIQHIEQTLGADVIALYDRLDAVYEKKCPQANLRTRVSKAIDGISDMIAYLTKPFYFEYRFNAYINLAYYFKKVREIVVLEREYRIQTTPNPQEAQGTQQLKVEAQESILEKYTVYKNRKLAMVELSKLNQEYHLASCSKLKVATILLLFRDKCPYLNKNEVKQFNRFLSDMCCYFELEPNSYKINDCQDLKSQLLRESPIFWGKMERGSL